MEILKLALKHKYTLIVTILVCTAVGAYVGTKYGAPHLENSIFIDVSIQDKYQHTSSYENLEAADQITESIQGWIKDPSFQDAVNKTAAKSFPIQSKKQEKNNLIITFNTDTADTESSHSSLAFGQLIIEQLKARISQYNANSDLNIVANVQPLQSTPKSSQFLTFTVLSALAGIFLGLFLLHLLHILFPKSK